MRDAFHPQLPAGALRRAAAPRPPRAVPRPRRACGGIRRARNPRHSGGAWSVALTRPRTPHPPGPPPAAARRPDEPHPAPEPAAPHGRAADTLPSFLPHPTAHPTYPPPPHTHSLRAGLATLLAVTVLLSSPLDAEAARSSGRVGGSAFRSSAPSRSYAPSASRSGAASSSRSYGGGGSTVIVSPGFGYGYGGGFGLPFFGGGYGGYGGYVAPPLVGGGGVAVVAPAPAWGIFDLLWNIVVVTFGVGLLATIFTSRVGGRRQGGDDEDTL